MSWESASLIISCSNRGQLQEVQNREQKYPNQVHEVPEQTGDFLPLDVTLRVGLPHAGPRTPNLRDDQRATQDVQAMQRGQGEVNRKVSAVPRHKRGESLDLGSFDR